MDVWRGDAQLPGFGRTLVTTGENKPSWYRGSWAPGREKGLVSARGDVAARQPCQAN